MLPLLLARMVSRDFFKVCRQQHQAPVAFTFLVLTVSCGTQQPALLSNQFDPSAASAIPGFHPLKPQLGDGFDSVSSEVLKIPCVSGETERAGNTVGQVKYARNLKFQEIMSQFGGGLNLGLPEWAGFQAGFEYARENHSGQLSDTHSIFLTATPKSLLFKPASLELTPTVREILSSDQKAEIHKYCGDEFVAQVDLGATLMATLKVDFASERDKREFNANADLRIALGDAKAELGGKIDNLSESVRTNTQITIRALQLGGTPGELFAILPDKTVVCNLTDLTPCLEIFANVIAYAQSGFKTQLDDAHSYNVVRVLTQPYAESVPALWDMKTPGVSPENEDRFYEQMSLLTDLFAKQKMILAQAEIMKSQFADAMTDQELQQITTLSRNAESNYRSLKKFLASCRRQFDSSGDANQITLLPTDTAILQDPLRRKVLVTNFAEEPERWVFQTTDRSARNPSIVTGTRDGRHALEASHLSYGVSAGVMCLTPSSTMALSRTFTLDEAGTVEISLSGFVYGCSECGGQTGLLVDGQMVLELSHGLEESPRSIQMKLNEGQHVVTISSQVTRLCQADQFVYLKDLSIERFMNL